MSKHAPWKGEVWLVDETVPHHGQRVYAAVQDGYKEVVTIRSQYYLPSERQAIARLIAAAPDLLDIAERYREALDGETCTCHLCVAHCPVCCEKELIEQAIAKARGESDE